MFRAITQLKRLLSLSATLLQCKNLRLYKRPNNSSFKKTQYPVLIIKTFALSFIEVKFRLAAYRACFLNFIEKEGKLLLVVVF